MKPNKPHARRLLRQLLPIFFCCAFAFAQDTPMFRGDLVHSGIYAAAGVPKLNGIKWIFRTRGELISSPAIANGVVYIGSTDGNLYALE